VVSIFGIAVGNKYRKVDIAIKYYFNFNHKCPTYSGEPTLVNSERTAASAADVNAKSASSVNTTCCSAENASENLVKLSASLKPDEHDLHYL
jgi:hypothetical protein